MPPKSCFVVRRCFEISGDPLKLIGRVAQGPIVTHAGLFKNVKFTEFMVKLRDLGIYPAAQDLLPLLFFF